MDEGINLIKIAILGGTRFFGKQLAEVLAKHGYIVDVFSHNINSSFKIDRSNKFDLEKIFKNKYDVIIDNICFGSSDAIVVNEYFSKNKELMPRQYIVTSTSFVYRKLKRLDYNESITFAFENLTLNKYPSIDYAIGKQESEYVFLNGVLADKLLIIRPPYMIGVDDHTNRLKDMIELVKNRTSITLNKNDIFYMSFVDIKLLSESIVALIEKSETGILNIANSGCINNKEIYTIISNILNKKITFNIINSYNDLLHPYSLEKGLCLNIDKFKKTYDGKIIDVKESFRVIIKEIIEKN